MSNDFPRKRRFTALLDLTTRAQETAKNDAAVASLTSEAAPAEAVDVSLADAPEAVRAAVARAGWPGLMPVQARTMAAMLASTDIIVQSKTGSGKTGAFLLPLFVTLDPSIGAPQALVMTPTRELARQIYEEFARLSGPDSPLRAALVYGGVGYGEQAEALKAGAQLVIGTPGRVLDLLERRTFSLDALKTLVLDEADEMLSMGFLPAMRKLRRYLPEPRQSTMFSATMPPGVRALARDFLSEPQFLALAGGHVKVDALEHRFYTLGGLERDRALVRIIELENPETAIVFANTKRDVEYLAQFLRNYGHDAGELSGDLSQVARETIMLRVREGRLRFLIATDVAARGIDISDLTHVIQYDVPQDPEYYVHRAGRTARAGKTGTSITLATPETKPKLLGIFRRYDLDFEERPVPTEEEVTDRVRERLTVLLEDRYRDTRRMARERASRFEALAQELASEEPHLLAMLLDGLYHESLHALPQAEIEAVTKNRATDARFDDDKPRGRREDRPRRDDRPERSGERSAERPSERSAERPHRSDAPGDVTEDVPDTVSGPDVMRTDAPASPEGESEERRRKRKKRRKKKGGAPTLDPMTGEAMPDSGEEGDADFDADAADMEGTDTAGDAALSEAALSDDAVSETAEAAESNTSAASGDAPEAAERTRSRGRRGGRGRRDDRDDAPEEPIAPTADDDTAEAAIEAAEDEAQPDTAFPAPAVREVPSPRGRAAEERSIDEGPSGDAPVPAAPKAPRRAAGLPAGPFKISDLKAMSASTLRAVAADLGVADAETMRPDDLVFSVLELQAERESASARRRPSERAEASRGRGGRSGGARPGAKPAPRSAGSGRDAGGRDAAPRRDAAGRDAAPGRPADKPAQPARPSGRDAQRDAPKDPARQTPPDGAPIAGPPTGPDEAPASKSSRRRRGRRGRGAGSEATPQDALGHDALPMDAAVTDDAAMDTPVASESAEIETVDPGRSDTTPVLEAPAPRRGRGRAAVAAETTDETPDAPAPKGRTRKAAPVEGADGETVETPARTRSRKTAVPAVDPGSPDVGTPDADAAPAPKTRTRKAASTGTAEATDATTDAAPAPKPRARRAAAAADGDASPEAPAPKTRTRKAAAPAADDEASTDAPAPKRRTRKAAEPGPDAASETRDAGAADASA